MSSSAHNVRYDFAEYLSVEEASAVKHEYLDGQIYAVAGGTPEHAALGASVSGVLFGALRGGPCRVFDSTLRVRVLATGLATYPDVTVVCGPRRHDPASGNTVVNPTLLVEVTSRSTCDYDRGEKFDHYRQIESLAEYVLVSHRERSIEVRRRAADGSWSSQTAGAGGRVELASIGCALDVDAVYTAAADPLAAP